MRNFLLDENPHFGEAKVTIGITSYKLTRIRENGCFLNVEEHGVERDQLSLTVNDMKALFLLLSTNSEKK